MNERVVHVTTFARPGGGMQSLVRRHRARDGESGFAAQAVAIFDPPAPGVIDVGLAAHGGWTLGGVRRAFLRQAHPLIRDAIAVYHNGWAMPLLAPGDGARRRLAFLHTDRPDFAVFARAIAPWCDTFLCVSEELAGKVAAAIAGEPPRRIVALATPIDLPARARGPKPRRAKPAVGYVGRLECAQKRVGRLRPIVARLGDAADWVMIGDGPERARLQRALAARGNVTFRGWLEGEAYGAALRELDAIVFTSDFEGTPLALIEAMACGAIPLFPAIGGDGERLARAVDPRCVYPPGDLAAAAAQLGALLGDRDQLGPRARAAVAERTPAAYGEAYGAALRHTIAAPRASREVPGRKTRVTDLLPLALIGRVHERALWQ